MQTAVTKTAKVTQQMRIADVFSVQLNKSKDSMHIYLWLTTNYRKPHV